MARRRFTPEEIIGELREAEVLLAQGSRTGEVCRVTILSDSMALIRVGVVMWKTLIAFDASLAGSKPNCGRHGEIALRLRACLPILLVATMFGCTKNYPDLLRTWIGKPEAQLIESWGPPKHVYSAGGQRYLTYETWQDRYIPGQVVHNQNKSFRNKSYMRPLGGSAGYTVNYECATIFAINGSGIIVD